MKTCFIIMPITTPEHLLRDYSNDEHHFEHVLDYLFVPVVNELGLDAIKPISIGSELIHADIIRQLAQSDIVLCDMSCLNPNVFFELGIRTALNKPVCLVRDEKTPHIPFDVSAINSHTYNSDLSPWLVDQEKPRLSKHIAETIDRCNNVNALWGHFSISASAQTLAPAVAGFDMSITENPLISLIAKQLDSLETNIHEKNHDIDLREIESRLANLEGQFQMALDAVREEVASRTVERGRELGFHPQSFRDATFKPTNEA